MASAAGQRWVPVACNLGSHPDAPGATSVHAVRTTEMPSSRLSTAFGSDNHTTQSGGRATTSGGSTMLTQSTLKSRSLLSRRRLPAVLATAGLALTGAAPAGASTFVLNFTKIQYTYAQQKPDGTGQVAAQGATAAGKAP